MQHDPHIESAAPYEQESPEEQDYTHPLQVPESGEREYREWKPSLGDRLIDIVYSKPGIAVQLAFVAYCATMVGSETFRHFHHEGPEAVSCTLDNEKVHFVPWSQFPDKPEPKNETEPRTASPFLKKLRQPGHTYAGASLPLSNPKAFQKWIAKKLADPEILGSVGISDIEEASPKKWVELAAAISMDAFDYDPRTASNLDKAETDKEKGSASEHLYQTSDLQPVDVLLMQDDLHKDFPVVCRHYAQAVEQVFNQCKKLEPEELRDIDVVAVTSPELNHALDIVVEQNDNHELTTSYIDATWGDNGGWLYNKTENFAKMIGSLRSKGAIDFIQVKSLGMEYFGKGEGTNLELAQFLQEYGMGFPELAPLYDRYAALSDEEQIEIEQESKKGLDPSYYISRARIYRDILDVCIQQEEMAGEKPSPEQIEKRKNVYLKLIDLAEDPGDKQSTIERLNEYLGNHGVALKSESL